jgi:hypothetical protein
MRYLCCFSLLFLISFSSFGTAQIPEILIYNEDTLAMFDCPLSTFPQKELIKPQKLFNSSGCFFSACWRNYVGTWTIVDGKLYLLNIRNPCFPTKVENVAIHVKNESDKIGNEYADFKKIFGDRVIDGRVFADWYNGNMYLPKGKLVYYVHDGFASSYEKEHELIFEKGLLMSEQLLDNSKSRQIEYESLYETKDVVGGQAFLNHIDSLIHWDVLPEIKDSLLRVTVMFSGNELGQVDSVKILRPCERIFEDEAIRVVKSLPATVRYFHGKFKRSYYTLPICFFESKRKKYLEENK